MWFTDTDDDGVLDDVKRFYYNEQWQCLEEQDYAGNLQRQYVWRPYYIDALAVTYDDQGTKHFYCHDANFNITLALDSSGNPVERYHYAPYGEVTILDANFANPTSSSSIGNEHLYTARRTDPVTGLQLNRHRYYHAKLGRWVTRDPIGYEGSEFNLYEYINGNPLGFSDAFGLTRNTECQAMRYRSDCLACCQSVPGAAGKRGCINGCNNKPNRPGPPSCVEQCRRSKCAGKKGTELRGCINSCRSSCNPINPPPSGGGNSSCVAAGSYNACACCCKQTHPGGTNQRGCMNSCAAAFLESPPCSRSACNQGCADFALVCGTGCYFVPNPPACAVACLAAYGVCRLACGQCSLP